MKLYRDYAGSSVSMRDSPELRLVLRETIERYEIRNVLESGTNIGLGSTLLIAESFPGGVTPHSFVTIEAGWWNWRRARRNLKHLPYIDCVWGQSLKLEEAVRFVQSDVFLASHREHPDIFIDDIEDPVGFYVRELQGQYGATRKSTALYPLYLVDRRRYYRGDDLLKQSMTLLRTARPLITLDAAGGAGLLEFETVLQTMGDTEYTVLLDDVHHVKHYRSLQMIKADPCFTILGLNEQDGWVVAHHRT